MIIDAEDHLAHYGTLHKSGRYPWGSGESSPARNRDFLMVTNDLLKQGMTPTEVAQGFEMTTTRFRAGLDICRAPRVPARLMKGTVVSKMVFCVDDHSASSRI